MEGTIDQAEKFFQFKSKNPSIPVQSRVLKIGRYLLGSADNCDIYIGNKNVSAIHCVLEISPKSVNLYNLDIETEIIVNGKSGNVHQLNGSDIIEIGGISLEFLPVSKGAMPTSPFEVNRKDSLSSRDKAIYDKEEDSVPKIIYPFDKDYNFETSEYIFEDGKKVFPIFKYDTAEQSVEVTVLFNRRVFSIDFITGKDGMYHITGNKENHEDVEFLYLPKSDKIPFIEVKNKEFFVHSLDYYEKKVFGDDQSKENQRVFTIDRNEIVQFSKGNLSIVVRNVDRPPKVKPGPLFGRDKTLFRSYFLVLLVLMIPLYFINQMNIDKEDLEKDKAPKRIATILYKPKVKIFNKKIKKEKPKEVPREKEIKKVKETKPKKVVDKKTPQKKVAKKQTNPKPVKKVVKGTPPKAKKNTGKPAAKKAASNNRKKPTKSVTASPVPKARGKVEVYKNDQFVSAVNNLMAKGGKFKSVRTKGVVSGSSGFVGVKGVSGVQGVRTGKVSDKIGSFDGAKKGVQGFSSSAKGLTGSKTFYTAGVPSQTVILGSMDPDLIRKILREHLPQFRFCYQKELDRTAKKIEGVVKFNFTIGASGSVNRAGISRSTNVPASVKKCVLNVLRGIRFPKPRGGGTVEVSQPINFYPKSL
jgi:TonB family protein